MMFSRTIWRLGVGDAGGIEVAGLIRPPLLGTTPCDEPEKKQIVLVTNCEQRRKHWARIMKGDP